MSSDTMPQAKLTTIAEFPQGFMLENFAVRSDNSMLVTVPSHRELWVAEGKIAYFRLFIAS